MVIYSTKCRGCVERRGKLAYRMGGGEGGRDLLEG